MKKFLALLMVAMLTFSLVACGGDDAAVEENDAKVEQEVQEDTPAASKKDEAIDAFNKAGDAVDAASESMNKIGDYLNANDVEQELIDKYNTMVESQEGLIDNLNVTAEQLNSDEVLTDEEYDVLIDALELVETQEVELKAQLDQLYEDLTK